MVARDPALEEALRRHLGQGLELYAFQEADSTMETAHELAKKGAADGTLVFAARQTNGRGRLGRRWSSPEGGLYCSLIVRPTRPPVEIPQLSLVAGLAVAEALHELTGLFPAIRWPNDVLVSNRKVCGILVEAKAGAAIIGIGVNVAAPLEELPDTATSLAAQGATCDRFQLTDLLYHRCMAWYEVWQREGFVPIREALRPRLGFFGHPVHITTGATQFEGTAADLDDAGRLLVRLDSGIVRTFEVGEVTLLR